MNGPAANPLQTTGVPRSMFAAHTGLLYDRVWVVSDGFLLGAQSSRLKPKFGSRTFCAHHLPGVRKDESKGKAAGGRETKRGFLCASSSCAHTLAHALRFANKHAHSSTHVGRTHPHMNTAMRSSQNKQRAPLAC